MMLSDGSTVQFWRDGEIVYDINDPEPYTEGWFGLRTVRNHMRIDDFKIYQLGSRSGVLQPPPRRLPGLASDASEKLPGRGYITPEAIARLDDSGRGPAWEITEVEDHEYRHV